jgi:hypothetical protein
VTGCRAARQVFSLAIRSSAERTHPLRTGELLIRGTRRRCFSRVRCSMGTPDNLESPATYRNVTSSMWSVAIHRARRSMVAASGSAAPYGAEKVRNGKLGLALTIMTSERPAGSLGHPISLCGKFCSRYRQVTGRIQPKLVIGGADD